jgi:hypothetical protein
MRRTLQIGMATVAASAALAGGVALATGDGSGPPGRDGDRRERIVLLGREGEDNAFVNVNDSADGPGDYTVFRDDLLSEGKSQTKVGDNFIICVGQFAPAAAQCEGVARLEGRGDITFQGLAPRDISEDFTIAVTGGTGDFRNVRGEATLELVSPDPFTQRFRLDLIGVR